MGQAAGRDQALAAKRVHEVLATGLPHGFGGLVRFGRDRLARLLGCTTNNSWRIFGEDAGRHFDGDDGRYLIGNTGHDFIAEAGRGR